MNNIDIIKLIMKNKDYLKRQKWIILYMRKIICLNLSKELKKLRKYGEKFMHICRKIIFSSLLEKEGLLIRNLNKYFAQNSRS